MMLSEEFLERIKQSRDIVSMMSGVARLKKAGRDFVCLCPFHSEKTPSCHVYTDSQSFYCFGCGSGGDVITFVRLTQNIDYMSAVRLLAEQAGIALPEDDERSGEELRMRGRIYEMNKEAARFFRDCLVGGGYPAGLEFLRQRGLSDNTIRRYGLGYAPDSWNALKYHMNGLGYNDNELVAASLLRQNESGRVYDMFRDRVMFPVIERTGKVVAFSGRMVRADGFGGKYVNSSETPVYTKGEHLFSLNFAKNANKKYMVLCEGNMDAVMLNQAGFDNAVAILGTALTPAQARLLRFYCEEVVLAYDSDVAGEKATVKAINLLNREGIAARVLQLPKGGDGEGGDPDSYIKRYGASGFAALLEKSGSAIAFEMDKLKNAVDIETPGGRAEYLKKAVTLLAQLDNKLDRMVYVSTLARECDVTAQWVGDAVDSAIKAKQRYSERDADRAVMRAGGYSASNANAASNSGAGQAVYASQSGLNQPVQRAECGIIAFLFHSPDKLPVILRKLAPSDFPTVFHRKLFETLILRLNKRLPLCISSLQGEFSAEEAGKIESIKRRNAVVPFTDERLDDYIEVLLQHKESQNKKDAADMSNEELLEYTKKIKEKKKISV